MALPVSASLSTISPLVLFNDGFELSDQTIIPNENFIGSFTPEINRVEFYVYDANITLLDTDYNFTEWNITDNSDTQGYLDTDTLQIDPIKNALDKGYDTGLVYAVYPIIGYNIKKIVIPMLKKI